MKEKYENMICEVISFETADVITSSSANFSGGYGKGSLDGLSD